MPVNTGKWSNNSKISTQRPDQLVYSDTCGQISVLDVKRQIFYQTFIDDTNWMMATFPMEHKYETFNNIERYKQFMKTRGYDIKTLCTDQGT